MITILFHGEQFRYLPDGLPGEFPYEMIFDGFDVECLEEGQGRPERYRYTYNVYRIYLILSTSRTNRTPKLKEKQKKKKIIFGMFNITGNTFKYPFERFTDFNF